MSDLKFIAKAPVYAIGLTVAAIFGLIFPYDARKLYANLELGMATGSILAPCFQPCA